MATTTLRAIILGDATSAEAAFATTAGAADAAAADMDSTMDTATTRSTIPRIFQITNRRLAANDGC